MFGTYVKCLRSWVYDCVAVSALDFRHAASALSLFRRKRLNNSPRSAVGTSDSDLRLTRVRSTRRIVSNFRKAPVPCSPHASSTVTLALLTYFFLSSVTLTHKGGFLSRRMGSFILRHRQADVFSDSATTSVHCLLILMIRAYMLSKVAFFGCFRSASPTLVGSISPLLLLKVCINSYLTCFLLG